MKIDDMTIGDLKRIQELIGGGKSHSLPVGKAVFIRTATNYLTGRIVEVTGNDIRLEDAAWIPDTGIFSEALKTGKLEEVEPYPSGVWVFLGACIDLTEWEHDLPREKK